MIPTVHQSTSRFSRFCAHLKSGLKRLVARFYPSSHHIAPQKSDTHHGIPVSCIHWQLDCPYSEKPLYRNTVVYVDLNSQEPEAPHKNKRSTNNTSEEVNVKITHFPTTHRLH